jgi:hypothetical protein
VVLKGFQGNRMVKAWENFWFQADGAKQVSLFRRAFAWILFGSYFSRGFDLELYYSDKGLLKSDSISDLLNAEYLYSPLNYFHGLTFLWMLHGLFLICLLSLAFGRFTRTATILALGLHLSFVHRSPGFLYGLDAIASCYLFYLSLQELCSRKSEWKIPVSSMAFRLMQIQICVIYAYSGFEKLRGPAWWDGNALWYALINSHVSRWDLSWIAHLPWVSVLLGLFTYGTLLLEIYFPMLVWSKRWKFWALGAGVAMHVMIGVVFRLPFFAAVMISIYVLFLSTSELRQLEQQWKKFCLKLKLG